MNKCCAKIDQEQDDIEEILDYIYSEPYSDEALYQCKVCGQLWYWKQEGEGFGIIRYEKLTVEEAKKKFPKVEYITKK